MTRWTADSEPGGLAGDCFYVLGMYGGCGTTRDLYGWLVLEGEAYTYKQVHSAMRGLAGRKPPIIEQAAPGRRYPPRPTLWRITGHGHEKIREWTGDDEDDELPIRLPCGLGWPA